MDTGFRSMLRSAGLFGAVLALGGCTGLTASDYPASDMETHVLDESLIGMWELVGTPEDPQASDGDHTWVLIGRASGREAVLEVGMLELDRHQELDLGRGLLFTTRIGDRAYLSVNGESSEDEEGRGGRDEEVAPADTAGEAGGAGEAGDPYLILHYTHVDPRTVKLYLLDNDAVEKAIAAGEITGEVSHHPNTEESEIVLDANTRALRTWLETAGTSVFEKEPTFLLRRME